MTSHPSPAQAGAPAASGLRWRRASEREPVPVELFGKDHWSTFAYVETRATDHRGVLDHDRMRCSAARHPMMMQAKRPQLGHVDAARFATRLKGAATGTRFAIVDLADHDDYDCLDDLIDAGLLTVRMPVAQEVTRLYLDVKGQPIVIDDQAFRQGSLTGMDELMLGAYATWGLTALGREAAGRLRDFKAGGGRFHDFVFCPAG